MAIAWVPGPGARVWAPKTMRRLLFHGPGGPQELRIVDCGMWIEKEKIKIRNPQFEIRNPIGRCFLNPRPLPPGHNQSISELSNGNSPPAEPGVYHDEINAKPYPQQALGLTADPREMLVVLEFGCSVLRLLFTYLPSVAAGTQALGKLLYGGVLQKEPRSACPTLSVQLVVLGVFGAGDADADDGALFTKLVHPYSL